jgi:CheY-like chemotaxis protein
MSKKIFILEDSPELLALLEESLQREGFAVVAQDTGRDALAKIKEASPDLVLLDIMLPVLDGHAIANLLSADEATKNIPIMVLSALGQAKPLFEKFGQVKGFFPKPVRIAELLEAIKTAVPA